MSLLAEKIKVLRDSHGVSEEICQRLAIHIAHEPASGLIRLSPYHLANLWGVPHLEMLEACLYATRLGILDLSWMVRCPSCREQIVQHANLQHLKSNVDCKYCYIEVEASFDELIEVIFNVNRNIQPYENPDWLELYQYWQWFTPHANLFTVPAHETIDYPITLSAGSYQLHRAPHVQYTVPIAVLETTTAEVQPIHIINDETDIFRRDKIFHHTGSFNLTITNDTNEPVDLMLSRYNVYPWVTAADVASTQIFRDLFTTELISADESFAIQNMVFVFTDIKGSTKLYEQLGDSQAYYLVKQHFKTLTTIFRQHQGAIVKTIGDAVMATFTVSAQAIKAIIESQQAFEVFNRAEHQRDDIIIKVGAHRGPCIAVTSNDRLDYFGRTVNIAARVQGLSVGNDMVISQSLYDEPSVQAVLAEYGWQDYQTQANLKGIEQLYNVVYLTPPPA